MLKISVVMPVYNCGQYLEQSVRSVVCQTMQELEIICVEDGSTDNSLQILKQLQSKDGRIKIISQENGGAGRARNAGLEKAEGRYVAFLDADDYYLEADALEEMYLACEREQVQVCGSLRKRLISGVEEDDLVFPNKKEQPPVESICQYKDYQSDYNYQSFLFKKELLINNHILFPVYRRFQDPPFFVKAMYAAGEFCMVDKYLYCYRMPAMAKRFDTEKAVDLLKGLIDNLEFAERHGLDILFKNTLHRLNYDYACIIYRNITRSSIGIIKLLIRANQLVCNKLMDPCYILKPLYRLLKDIEADISEYEARLKEKVMHSDNIYIYGAGRLSELFLEYLEKENLKDRVKGVIVSKMDGNPKECGGIPVKSLDNFQLGINELIFIAVRVHFQESVVSALEKRKYVNYEVLDTEFMDMLERKSDIDDNGMVDRMKAE